MTTITMTKSRKNSCFSVHTFAWDIILLYHENIRIRILFTSFRRKTNEWKKNVNNLTRKMDYNLPNRQHTKRQKYNFMLCLSILLVNRSNKINKYIEINKKNISFYPTFRWNLARSSKTIILASRNAPNKAKSKPRLR